MSKQALFRSFMVSEFHTNVPDVPFFSEVDIDALTDGDEDPVFVVLSVLARNVVSANGLVYDDGLIQAVVESMPGMTGIMGHTPEELAGTAYPLPDIFWVGQMETSDGVIWGKGYIPPTKPDVRAHVRQLKAAGGMLATSIWGPAVRVDLDAGKWLAQEFKLKSLDLAPANRAALELGAGFDLTVQMDSDKEKDKMADITLKDVPKGVRAEIIAEFRTSEEGKQLVADLASRAEIAEKAVEALKKELATSNAHVAAVRVVAHISEIVSVEALRPVVYRYVVAETADISDVAGATATADEYIKSDEFKALTGATKQPPAVVPPRVTHAGSGQALSYDEIAKDAELAVANRKLPG